MASIQCGNCKSTHSSVREVRECYGHKSPSEQAAASSPKAGVYGPYGTAQGPSAPQPATEKQMSFLRSLLDQRDHEWSSDATLSLAEQDKRQASKFIDALVKLPVRKQAVKMKGAKIPDVPEGRYAVQDGQKLRFVKVDRPEDGKWQGYTFMKEQASDELFPVKGERMVTLLALILEQGVTECLARYGQELGKCGKCGRTLTDEESRRLGIGPVCREGL